MCVNQIMSAETVVSGVVSDSQCRRETMHENVASFKCNMKKPPLEMFSPLLCVSCAGLMFRIARVPRDTEGWGQTEQMNLFFSGLLSKKEFLDQISFKFHEASECCEYY